MVFVRSRLLGLLSLLLILVAFWPFAGFAQGNIQGNVINKSLWNGAATPGGVAQNGAVHVGVWNAAGDPIGPPLAIHANLNTATPLPFGTGVDLGTYTVAMAGDGDYLVVAWIETDGDQRFDAGEPASAPVSVSIEGANQAGINLEVKDDVDNDGMADWWEVYWFGDLEETGGSDPDVDTLSNSQEYNISLNITNLAMLDPSNWDTDGDLMHDGWEYSYYANGTGTDPLTPDAFGDPDGDGLLNLQEYNGVNGEPLREQDPAAASGIARVNPDDGGGDALNPVTFDTDGDYLIDSFEAAWYDSAGGINPRSAGNYKTDQDNDGLSNYREQCLLAELAEGGANDIWSVGIGSLPSADGNGLRAFSPALNLGMTQTTISADLVELRNEEWTDPSLGTSYTESLNPGWDTDEDLLPDGWEVEFNLDPKVGSGADGYFGDPDGDNLVNFQEYNGQDGDRSTTKPYVNGNGDETNPNEHNHVAWNAAGEGVSRPLITDSNWWIKYDFMPSGTLGSARPTISVGYDTGTDTDDDGYDDEYEIQEEFVGDYIGSSPVHSMHPFHKACGLIISNAGTPIPDPEGNATDGYRPLLHKRNWTIECQIKTKSSNLSGYLLECPGPWGAWDVAWSLSLSNDIPRLEFDTLGLKRYYVTGLAIPTNKWIHIAGVFDTGANSLSLYVNGIFVQEQRVYEESLGTYLYASASAPMIGRSPDNSFANEVYIDEIRIWGEARTPEDIEMYRTKLVPPDASGLLAYYRFDDRGTSFEDFTRKAKNGLLGATSQDYYFGDYGYALSTNDLALITNDYARVRGVDRRGADDSDGDGLPDGWEMVNHLNPFSASGANGASGDPDGDLLGNLYEFWSDTNPNAADTDQDSTFDRNEDKDGDGVVNKTEQDLNSRPDMVDTDDDGWTDSQEREAGTSPANPTDPSTARVMAFGGAAGDYLTVPNAFEQRLSDWTLEAWVYPTNEVDGVGSIVRRVVETPVAGSAAINFVLGVTTNATGLLPYAGYQFTNGTSYYAYGDNIPSGTWTHVAASYDSLNARLTMYTNGFPTGTPITDAYLAPPMNGKGGETFLRIGEDFGGMIDDVRIWNDVRTLTEVSANFESPVSGGTAGLIHYFRFDDGQANTNLVPFGEYHQPYGPQDFVHNLDWNQEWRHAATFNSTNMWFVSGGPIVVPPSLSVILEPVNVRAEGAQWSIDGGGWRDSGEIATVNPGSRVLGYKSITGWTEPTNETITLVNGEARSLTRTYVKDGSLQITIEPVDARLAGARWQVDGGAWRDSDAVVDNLSVGNHLVSFSDITGWNEPASFNIPISAGQTSTSTVWYTRIQASLLVYLEPPMVVSNGAQWRVDSGLWLDSGVSVSPLYYGPHTVEFLEIPPWVTPDDEIVNVVSNATIVITGRYSQVSGIQVLISPPEAITNGAQWRITGGSWQDSGDVLALSPNTYAVEFSEIGILVKPPDMSVVVTNDTVTQVLAAYYDLNVYGSLGSGAQQLRSPRGLATDDRYLYIADTMNHRIQVVDLLTETWLTIGSRGSGLGQFYQPMGLAIDSSGNLWVADAGNHRIQRRTPAGVWNAWGGWGSAAGQFNGPFDIDVDSAGNAYVVDHYNDRVQKRTAAGVWTTIISAGDGNGKVRRPGGIAVDDAQNRIYVTDYNAITKASRVQKFTTTGAYVATVGSSGSSSGGFNRPRGLDVADVVTNVYVADQNNDRVQMLTGTSLWTVIIGSGFLDAPEDVVLDKWGNLFIADSGSNRVLRLPAIDSDGDELPDWVETDTGAWSSWRDTGSDPNDPDTDGDGFEDGREVRAGTNPNNISNYPPIVACDFDGDAISDVALYAPDVGLWRFNSSSIGVGLEAGGSVYWGISTDMPVPADYDGDGFCDIAVWRPATGDWWIRMSSTMTIERQRWGMNGDMPVPADYDGDGMADYGIFRPANGNWYIILSGGGTSVQHWGMNGDIPVCGDYDGDGICDLSVYRPANRTWYVNKSGGGTTVQVWGAPGDVPVPADYDGDGTNDIAVWRSWTGEWWIRQSLSGTVRRQAWGFRGDIPVPADYDGDGMVDLGIYRPSSTRWYVLLSGGGVYQPAWGWYGNRPVLPQYYINRKMGLVP